MRLIKLLCIFFLALHISSLTGCGSEDLQPTSKLTSIEITSANGKKLDLNTTTVLTATGFDQFNDLYDISSLVSWTVNNEKISLDQNGNVTALVVGTSVVKATAEGVEGTFSITVWDSSAPRTEIYVSDNANFENGPWKILKYNVDGSNPEVFTNSNLNQPQDVLFLEDQGIVLVSNYGTGRITKYNSNTGAYLGDFASGLPAPTRIKIGPDRLLYVLFWNGTSKVHRYNQNGTFVDEFTSVGVNEGLGLDWDASGNLYVSSYNEGAPGFVRKFDTSGNDLGLFISSNLTGPSNIWFDASGSLLVNDFITNNVKKFDSNGNFLGIFISGVTEVEGVGFLPNGDILLGSGGTKSIKMYTSSGTFIKDFVPAGGGVGGLVRPNGITVRRVNF